MTEQAQTQKSVLERIQDLENQNALLMQNAATINTLVEVTNILKANAGQGRQEMMALSQSNAMNNKFLTALIRSLTSKSLLEATDLFNQINKMEDDEKTKEFESMINAGLLVGKPGASAKGDVVTFSTKTINTSTGTEQVLRSFDFVLLGNNEIAPDMDADLTGKSLGDAFSKQINDSITQVVTVLNVLSVIENKEVSQGE